MASKFAGRLPFSTSICGGRVGRAYVKPLFAQAYDTPRGGAILPMLAMAIRWVCQYLDLHRGEATPAHMVRCVGCGRGPGRPHA